MLRQANHEYWRQYLRRRKVNPALAATWSAMARPNVRLIPKPPVKEDTTPPLASKFGGLPDLAKGTDWPAYQFVPWQSPPREPGFFGRLFGQKAETPKPPPSPQVRSPSFLAQINLADIANVGLDLPLPESGLLLFFYDHPNLPTGYDPKGGEGFMVLFVPEGTMTQRPASPPVAPAPVRVLEFQAGEVLPCTDTIEEAFKDDPDYSDDDFLEEIEKADSKEQSTSYDEHAFGGWPAPMQGPLEDGCESFASDGSYSGTSKALAAEKAAGVDVSAKAWRLLLQLDSTDVREWDWGDCGKVYFLCREFDIAERRFERCCAVHQMG